jgi:uncharacterized protein
MTIPTGYQLEIGPAEVSPLAEPNLVAMRDGTRLATEVYLPATSPARNAILIRLPYDKCGRYTFVPAIAEYLTARGFAVAAQDVPGKFRSQGSIESFIREASDGCDTLDWIASRPWTTGRVGMDGDSYYGFTQWAAASSRHPALRGHPHVLHDRDAHRPDGGLTSGRL